jgi:hypothetical protein
MGRFTKAKYSCFVKGLIVLFAFSFSMFFTTCDTPMGMGNSIDFEPPILTMDPERNPKYVRLGTKLRGKVTDNISVDRVIMRRAGTGEEMFKATITGERWEMALVFNESRNGERIMTEIVAFDKAGNSGDTSIKAITLIVDIGPPVVEDIWIQRTVIERAYLETYHDITNLEVTDPNGENSSNLNMYQNGYFTIAGKVREDETRIEIVSLNIYDALHPNTELLNIPLEEGVSAFNPSWLVKEEDILAAGDKKIDPEYSNRYYDDNKRYYYRVVIVAEDRSQNESRTIVEDKDYFCMWQKADEPKGILDPVMVGTLGGATNPVVVTKGSTLPVEFFDDDQLLWAYTGLLTLEQWNGKSTDPITGVDTPVSIFPGVQIPSNLIGEPDYVNQEKLKFLRNRIFGENSVTQGPIYNWEYDRKPGFLPTDKNTIGNEITGQINSKIIYVPTGNNDADNGEYVLFSLTSDTKLDPHTNDGPQDTNKPRERYRIWYVNVIDENEPIIVFDTIVTSGPKYVEGVHPGGAILETKGTAYRTGNSPEDNTFPSLLAGRTFEINGYTLRAKKTDDDKVRKFRMAWIPSGIGTGDNSADSYISRVQTALSALDYPASFARLGLPPIIQHWNFDVEDGAQNLGTYTPGKLLTGTDQQLDVNDKFKKQVFKKKFNVLGDEADDLKPSYYNFRTGGLNSPLENDIKLFVFYAEDSMGHVVYRQLRLLGNKKPPNLTVYDMTESVLPDIKVGPPNGLPDLTNKTDDGLNYYFYNSAGNIDDNGRTRYNATLKNYQNTGYEILGDEVEINYPEKKTEAYQPYTRDTILKYWIVASESGDLFVNDIKMWDITTNEERRLVGRIFEEGDSAISYVELLPDITMRVFLFEASDTLGNTASIQRTVAITNAARLENITTSTQTGTYGIGEKITIQANYSNLVKWTTTGNAAQDVNKPKLNVRYYEGGSISNGGVLSDGTQVIRQLSTITPADTPSLSLDFEFTVNENFTGLLETMYIDIGGPTGTGTGLQGNDINKTDRPINLPNNTRILDVGRGDDAFTPGYSQGYAWTFAGTAHNRSLQGPKKITLDGVRPRIIGFTFTPPAGKTTAWTGANPGYFLKSDDTIQFTLLSNKDIFTSGSPVIQFQVGTPTTARSAAWQRASTTKGMVFSVIVNATNTPDDGSVSNIRLANVSTIVDASGNAFASGTGAFSGGTGTSPNNNLSMNISTGGNIIRVDKTPPVAPATTIGGRNVPFTNIYFNVTPSVSLDINVTGDPTASEPTVPTSRQYSLDNGVSWNNYQIGGTANPITNGQHTVITRFTDRAGNIGATSPPQQVWVNAAFPKLLAITAVQSNGWYRSGTLTFNLDFEEPVKLPANTDQISITLKNRSTTARTGDTATATRTGIVNETNTIQVSFTIGAHDMRDGLYVSAIDFSQLQDRFGNTGPSGTATYAGANETGNAGSFTLPTGAEPPEATTYTCPNLTAGLKVDAVAPGFVTTNPTNPASGAVSPYPTGTGIGADKRNVITLTFNEPVQKGVGVITVQPRRDSTRPFLVPPVFEDTGYYIDCVDETPATASSNRTIWMPGFYDIYNSGLTAAQRNALTESTTEASQRAVASAGTIPSSVLANGTNGEPSMTRLRLNTQTGQPVGPYVKTTHGLKAGYGYSGNYSGAHGDNEVYGPNTATGFTSTVGGPTTDGTFAAMVPDTSTKWVLRYGLNINDNNDAITGIRNALQAAKFRWQEIDVGWGNVTISAPAADGATIVSIRLNEPLLQGLEWDLSYPAGTFTDIAGNNAPALAVNSYTFWSEGVRKPVIRVDRKSYDARGANWHVPRTGTANDSSSFTYAAPTIGEWAIGQFDNIAYRIESETPQATIYWGVTGTNNSTTGVGSGAYNAVSVNGGTTTVNADANNANTNGIAGTIWNGTIASHGNGYTATDWDAGAVNRSAFWVKPNLLRKFGMSGTYNPRSVQIVNGDQRRSSGSLSVLHSYNADATSAILSGLGLAAAPANQNWYTGTVGFGQYEAGKRYVVATAQRGATGTPSARGYEGVFRTLVVLNGQKGNRAYTGTTGTAIQNNAQGINKILIGGSNVKSGTPSIPGFPLQDGAQTGDARFVKMMHNIDNANNGTNTGKRFYWVSTEIVCEFYMVYFGNGGDVQRTGDVNNFLMVSYGDLSYAFKLDRFPD